jgi:hypothetical protein
MQMRVSSTFSKSRFQNEGKSFRPNRLIKMKKVLLLTMASFAVASNIRNSRVLGATGSAATGGSAETEQPLSATGDAEVPQTNKNAVWVSCF